MNLYRTKISSTMFFGSFLDKKTIAIRIPFNSIVCILRGANPNTDFKSSYMTLLTEYGILYSWWSATELLVQV